MLGEVFSAILELVTDETDAVEVGSHCELFVFNLGFLGACTFLCQGLFVEGKGENYVASDFTGVEGTVEASKFNCAVSVEKTVEVQEMVS